jgi:hypothetical protein
LEDNIKWTFGPFRIIIRDDMRKKILLISLIVGFCFLGLFCYKSWIITFVITKYLSGGTDGKQGIVKSIIIPWRNYQFHLHHWFIALLIGGVCVVKGFYILAPEISYGFISAIIFQGIYCYGDWYRIIRKKKRSANSGAANVGLAANGPVSQVVLQRSALLS